MHQMETAFLLHQRHICVSDTGFIVEQNITQHRFLLVLSRFELGNTRTHINV